MFKLLSGQYKVCSLEDSSQQSICIDTSKFYHIYNNNNQMNLVCEDCIIPNDIENNLFSLIEILKSTNEAEYLKFEQEINDMGIYIQQIQKGNHSYMLVDENDIAKLYQVISQKGYRLYQ